MAIVGGAVLCRNKDSNALGSLTARQCITVYHRLACRLGLHQNVLRYAAHRLYLQGAVRIAVEFFYLAAAGKSEDSKC